MRGSVIFDESSFLSAEMLQVYGAFAATNKSFKTGKDATGQALSGIRLRAIPKALDYQKFYFSSASSTDTEYYRLFKEFSMKMFAGDPNYFVAQLDCNVAFKPTMHGQLLSPLITPDVVETAMRTNPEKARREYYCQFTTDIGDQAIIKRGAITRNEETRIPVLQNSDPDRKFAICWDPARKFDSSVVLIMEIYQEGEEKKGRLVNCVSMVDFAKKHKTPKTIPAQVDTVRQIIFDYSSDEFYSNINVLCDAGSGGQASAIADLLAEEWTDNQGKTHRGIVDKEWDEELARNHPKASAILKLYEPTKYKSLFYEAIIQMIDEDYISFTAEYDNKQYLQILETTKEVEEAVKQDIIEECKQDGFTGSALEKETNKRLKNAKSVKAKVYKLSRDEEDALINMDVCKEQIVNMVRIKRDSGRDSFELAPEKRASVKHDDHAYVLAMAGYALKEARREDMKAQKPVYSNEELVNKLMRSTKKSSYKDRLFKR